MSTILQIDDKGIINQSSYTTEKPTYHLWSVIVVTPHAGTQTVFVLAANEENAKGQAMCSLKCAVYDLPADVFALVKVHATQLPLIVQGWGGQQF